MNNFETEIRADGTVRIVGYVNAVLRESRPVMTPRGLVNEIVEQRAFQNAIDNANNIDLLVDHNVKRKLGSTSQGNLELKEDEIGLRAECVITEPDMCQKAKDNQIKGWSFGFSNAKDSLEMRADKKPLRHLKGFDIKEVSLICDMTPCYSATSVEVRAGNEDVIEHRNFIEELISQEILEYQKGIETTKNNVTDDTSEPASPTEEPIKTDIIDEKKEVKIDTPAKEDEGAYMEYLVKIKKIKKGV